MRIAHVSCFFIQEVVLGKSEGQRGVKARSKFNA